MLQADSLPDEPQGKPKNTGVGSISLLQGIFPTQESNPGLLHCKWVFYQLGYQGGPQTYGKFSAELWFPFIGGHVVGVSLKQPRFTKMFLEEKKA